MSEDDQQRPPPERQIIAVNPARLAWEGAKRETCGGDIHEAYSADRISEGKPIRHPFEFGGSLWVTVSITGKGLIVTGEHELEAYRLVPPELFTGTPTTYAARCSDEARNDPLGFYNSVLIKHAGRSFVMHGPPATFIAEVQPERPGNVPEPEQMQLSLF